MKVSGRRYYSPSQGRFLGRDPKMEKGGFNLYGFVLNNPINLWDYLGMQWVMYTGQWDERITWQPEPGEYIWLPDEEPFDLNWIRGGGRLQMPDLVLWAAPPGPSGGGSSVPATPEYKGYKILSSIDGFYSKDKAQKTFVNPAMKGNPLNLNANSGSGADMIGHLQAKGLTVTHAGSLGAVKDSLGDGKVDVLTIGAHGGPGFIDMRGGVLSQSSVTASDDVWKQLKGNLNPGATIVLLGCEFGGDDYGVDSMQRIANSTGATIVAPTGKYGPIYTGSDAEPQWTGQADIILTGGAPKGMTPGYIIVPPKG